MNNYYIHHAHLTLFIKTWVICFLCLTPFSPAYLSAQSSTCSPNSVNNGNNDLWSPDCYLSNSCTIQGNPCQANDVQLTGAFIADINGNPIPTCTPGSTVNAFLWGDFEANASCFAVRSYAEILYDGVFSGLPQDIYERLITIAHLKR